jgi:hypothetical protein
MQLGGRSLVAGKRQDNQSPRGPCAGRGASGGFWGMSLMAAMALPAIWRFYRARRLAGLPIPVQTNKLWSLPSVGAQLLAAACQGTEVVWRRPAFWR